jgi:hypothetical protein
LQINEFGNFFEKNILNFEKNMTDSAHSERSEEFSSSNAADTKGYFLLLYFEKL